MCITHSITIYGDRLSLLAVASAYCVCMMMDCVCVLDSIYMKCSKTGSCELCVCIIGESP